MKFSNLLVVASFAALATSKSQDKNPSPSVVEIKLTPGSGSEVKVSVKNVGKKKLDFFQRGTVLDENPIHKLHVQSTSGSNPGFIGVHPRVRPDGKLNKKSFKTLKNGQTIEYTVDMASLYDLSEGGSYEVSTEGILPYSQPGKRKLTGDATYKSNSVTIEVNGTAAALVKHQLHRRNLMQPDCTAGRADATRNALAVCAQLAFVAGEMAIRGDVNQFARYFRTADPNIRQIVSRRFHAVSDECASRSNKAKTFCTDQRRLCRSDYISYTLGTEITNCDLYWQFPLVNTKCHGVGQATTTIHEMTHIDGLFDPATDDFPGHYGWPALSTLPPEQAIMNGDNYGFYANAIYTNDVNC